MFSTKALATLLYSTVLGHALLVPVQINHQAREVDLPVELEARDVPVTLDTREALEAEAIKYAEEGDLINFNKITARTARIYGDHETADILEGSHGHQKRQDEDSVRACLDYSNHWRVTGRTALGCWQSTYGYASSRDPYYHVINTAKNVLAQLYQGHMEAAKAGVKLLHVARQADAAALKRRSPEDTATGSGIERSVAPRSPTPENSDIMAREDFLGIHIHWHFLRDISQIISAIATAIVAATVCAESFVEPPGFLLLAAIIYGICASLTIEIVPSVLDLVATLTGH